MELDPTAALSPTTVGPPKSAAAPAPLGQFGPYEFLESFSGGMGVVFRARHTVLDRIVALKLLHPGRPLNENDRARFIHEARAIAQLRHPNVVEVIDYGEIDGQPFLTMEYVDGGNLARRLPEYVGQPRRAVELLEKVARAMQHAHDHRILHRDLKPGNILLRANGEPVVADFGLAKFLDADESITVTGALLGTPAYMAPEQFLGRSELVSTATDIWALGIILHELLTGKRPFPGNSRDELTRPVLAAEPTAPSALRADVPKALDAVVLRCLCREPAQRYASAGAFADDLALWLEGQRPKAKKPLTAAARRRRRWLIAGGVTFWALVAAPLIWWATLDREPRLRKTLELSGAVQLIGATGAPLSYRRVTDSLEVSTGDDGVFTVTSDGLGLLELMSTTGQDRFRFRAELQLVGEEFDSFGLYVGRETFRTDKGDWNTFVAATFTGCSKSADGQPQVMPHTLIGYSQGPKPTGGNVMSLENSKCAPEREERGRWRPVTFTVSTATIAADVTGKGVPFPRVGLMATAEKFATNAPKPLAGVTPTYPPAGGIGLYVQKSTVRVRNVTVERLEREQP